LPRIRLVDASDVPGAGYARHIGILHADSDRLAFCDADDAVCPGWLRAIHAGLENASTVAGAIARIPFEVVEQNAPSEIAAVAHFSDGPPTYRGTPYAPGGNCGWRKDALPQGYAVDYVVGEDGATSFRALLRGHRVVWCPDARLLNRERPPGARLFSRAVASGVARSRLDREFGVRLWPGARPYLTRTVIRTMLAAPRCASERGRARWAWEAGVTLGAVVEHLVPGLWLGRHSARAGRDPNSIVASTRGSSP
jgi:glycosyltransferase involved in cell wall biosynthesis